jgi:uncharacterized membrane protein YdjX (TVP38/TMEM64 family)
LEKYITDLFHQYPNAAILISIVTGILVALIGFLPSFFLTAANILFFGFWKGTLLSFLGEAIGAGLAFLLYRKGLRKAAQQKLVKYPRLNALVEARGKRASLLIFSMRLMPFIPSGLISLAAAIGKASFVNFLIFSSLGKIPALLIEAYSVWEISRFSQQGKWILFIISLILVIFLFKKKPSGNPEIPPNTQGKK